MKNILIINENLNEITKLKRFFGEGFKVSGSNNAENALSVMQNRLLDMVVYQVYFDMAQIFAFYKAVRQEPQTEKLPLVFITDADMLNLLNDVTVFENAVVIAAPVTEGAVESLLKSFFVEI